MKNKKKVVLKKVKDERFIFRYILGVINDKQDPGVLLLATTHAYSLDNRILLVLRTPNQIGFRTLPGDVPFGIAKTVQEADKRLYEKLLLVAPEYVRETNEFKCFYNETGMGRQYNYVKPKK